MANRSQFPHLTSVILQVQKPTLQLRRETARPAWRARAGTARRSGAGRTRSVGLVSRDARRWGCPAAACAGV